MELKPTDADLKIADDKPVKTDYLTVAMELYVGGNWLGACRAWMQGNLPHGDQITWGDDKQHFAVTPKQFEGMAYRVAVAAVNNERQRRIPDCGVQTLIRFSMLCRGAISDRPGARKREYKVDVYAPSLFRAKQAYETQTTVYDATFVSVSDAEVCQVDSFLPPKIVNGLRDHDGAFLVENLNEDW
jgi:hypothetical protein